MKLFLCCMQSTEQIQLHFIFPKRSAFEQDLIPTKIDQPIESGVKIMIQIT